MATPGKIRISKKLLNSPQSCVGQSMEGFLSWNPGLVSLPGCPNVILRRDWSARAAEGKVALVTGGGSGHEPCFVGFVGQGMATGAVHGDLFAAPSSGSVLSALLALGGTGSGGVLAVFNNYTGDRLNFGIAAERARSRGVKVELVVNADDCALADGAGRNCRRGLSGLVLLLKILGRMADDGESLEGVAEYARKILPNIVTMGVAWSPCSLPGGGPLFELGHNEMELGLGMHGEAGMKRVKMTTAKDAVSFLLSHMTNAQLQDSFIELREGVRVVVLLNNMGSTSDLEMNVLAREVLLQLSNMEDVTLDRMYVGRYVTSQEMAGFSITIMTTDDLINDCLDSRTSALTWVVPVTLDGYVTPRMRKCGKAGDDADDADNVVDDDDDDDGGGAMAAGSAEAEDSEARERGPNLTDVGHSILLRSLTGIANSMVANRDLLNVWDSASGDGDCGNTFAAGAKGIFKILQSGTLKNERNCCRIVNVLSRMFEDTMGGTTGALYSLFLTSISQELAEVDPDDPLTSEICIRAMRRGITYISDYGGAVPGDRTMIDPLDAACSHLEKEARRTDALSPWQQAVKVAEQEMKRTKGMEARAGRASYVNRGLLVHPDPGAKAVCLWLGAVVNALADNKKHL